MNEQIVKPGRALFWFNRKSGDKRGELCKKYFPSYRSNNLTEEQICFIYQKEITEKIKK